MLWLGRRRDYLPVAGAALPWRSLANLDKIVNVIGIGIEPHGKAMQDHGPEERQLISAGINCVAASEYAPWGDHPFGCVKANCIALEASSDLSGE